MTIITAEQLPDRNTGSRLVAEGRLIRLSRGLYSDEVNLSPESIVRDQWKDILAAVMPGAVITDRSAFTGRPVDGYLFVSHSRAREVVLPSLTIVPRKGLPAQPGDSPIGSGVYLASEPRALVENLSPSRAVKGRPPRTLERSELHDEVVRLASTRSPAQNQRLLAAVRDFGLLHGRQEDAEGIRVFFESASGDRPTVKTESRAMRAAQEGHGYDARRVARFERLADDLRLLPPRVRMDTGRDTYLPFFEAYFSNFIEGTEFTVADAADIALRGNIPESRPEDAHDILGTYAVVSNTGELTQPLTSIADYLDALRRRHSLIMGGRPNKHPGVFKAVANQAGVTEFVAPEHVRGTLTAGWEYLETLTDPFARAAFSMFLVSEVHPFDDGNGRVARIMMNAELSRSGYVRIIIPTVLRSDYLSALVGLTHNGRSEGLVSVLDFAQRYTAQVDFSDFERALAVLTATNAFRSSNAAGEAGYRIGLPSALPLGWDFRALQPDVEPTADQTFMDAVARIGSGDSTVQPRAGDFGAETHRGAWANKPQSPPDNALS